MSAETENLAYYSALAVAPLIGPVRFRILLTHFKKAKAVWELKEIELEKILGAKTAAGLIAFRTKTSPEEWLGSIGKKGIAVVADFQADYPKRLKQIGNHPPVLFYQGDLDTLKGKTIAVVGSRKPTTYGREVTELFVRDLVSAGFTIVSGMARGVDSIAALTTVKESGRTVAVLGGGLSQIYPPENVRLAKEITLHGAVLSEYAPETPSVPGNFPARNRIISGLAAGVLITEADEKSGSLITAGWAAEQGREVFAVPGPVYSRLSAGPAKLIKEGAKLVTNVGDILEEFKISSEFGVRNEELKIKGDTKEEQLIIDLLENSVVHVDEIGRKAKMPPAKISSLLSLLEIKGKISAIGNGNYSLKN